MRTRNSATVGVSRMDYCRWCIISELTVTTAEKTGAEHSNSSHHNQKPARGGTEERINNTKDCTLKANYSSAAAAAAVALNYFSTLT